MAHKIFVQKKQAAFVGFWIFNIFFFANFSGKIKTSAQKRILESEIRREREERKHEL